MTDWIVVVDDDTTNLKMAGHILSKSKKRVTAVKSGQMLLDYVRSNEPDLILWTFACRRWMASRR